MSRQPSVPPYPHSKSTNEFSNNTVPFVSLKCWFILSDNPLNQRIRLLAVPQASEIEPPRLATQVTKERQRAATSP